MTGPKPYPKCPHCGHTPWHGTACNKPTDVKGRRCGCPTSCADPTPHGMDEFHPETTTWRNP